jgi:hypothetical protein
MRVDPGRAKMPCVLHNLELRGWQKRVGCVSGNPVESTALITQGDGHGHIQAP